MEHPKIEINGMKACGILEQDSYDVEILDDKYAVITLPLLVDRKLGKYLIDYLNDRGYKLNIMLG